MVVKAEVRKLSQLQVNNRKFNNLKIEKMERRQIEYRLVQQMIGENKVRMFRANPKYRNKIGIDEICQVISLRSLLTEVDVKSILQAFLTNLSVLLMQSYTVRLGDLGYITSAIKTDQVAKVEDYTASNIRKAHPVFVPSTMLKREMRTVSYKLVSDKKVVNE